MSDEWRVEESACGAVGAPGVVVFHDEFVAGVFYPGQSSRDVAGHVAFMATRMGRAGSPEPERVPPTETGTESTETALSRFQSLVEDHGFTRVSGVVNGIQIEVRRDDE